MKRTRVFGGKRYMLYHVEHYKEHAQSEAKLLRKRGYNARIVKTEKGWGIYVRKKNNRRR